MATNAYSRTSCLRFAAPSARTCISQQPLKRTFTVNTRAQKPVRMSPLLSQCTAARQTAQHLRRAPSSSSRDLARHASTTASSPSAAVPEDILTWDRFFNLRRRRRFVNLGASAVCAITAIGIAGPVIASSDIDKTVSQTFGVQLDPFVVLGLTTFTVAAAGWMCGPSFGSAGFSMWAGRRGWNKAITEKEKSFYARIKRYRADPSSSSPQNPIPDYYGEKIASVKDYRRWLKDQRTFARKATKNMI